jgi:hypothetical protein
MISLLIAAALAGAPTAPAVAPAQASDRMICHKISYLGSRLNSTRICKTKQEWDQIQWEHDHEVRDAQEKNRTMKSN